MADIATVFGWTPATLDAFSLAELMDWRERARVRAGAE
ncbi:MULTISPECIES: GpE family phage tail protein [Burkholderia cepacia complex]|nr:MULTISPECIES: GpE family phage tail protein [Burkholderia cepacia complex]RQR49585.1 GpE family phage tail protein [Burkholderia sp. Bp9126]RQS10087.1 GpE family phage tail protein [Burkholderia sp. Bp9002]PAJ87921.1 GpE family phage tail protein [Burkholderia ubonensis]PAJ94387.1 GpE family phage tail protein [Burkholderia ubonensis]PAJ97728.1 GpE family phage tail protein [Burkholderia ubonensis]